MLFRRRIACDSKPLLHRFACPPYGYRLTVQSGLKRAAGFHRRFQVLGQLRRRRRYFRPAQVFVNHPLQQVGVSLLHDRLARVVPFIRVDGALLPAPFPILTA